MQFPPHPGGEHFKIVPPQNTCFPPTPNLTWNCSPSKFGATCILGGKHLTPDRCSPPQIGVPPQHFGGEPFFFGAPMGGNTQFGPNFGSPPKMGGTTSKIVGGKHANFPRICGGSSPPRSPPKNLSETCFGGEQKAGSPPYGGQLHTMV